METGKARKGYSQLKRILDDLKDYRDNDTISLEPLTEKQRVIFLMSVLEGRTIKEIADILGKHRHTIKYHLGNAKRVLLQHYLRSLQSS